MELTYRRVSDTDMDPDPPFLLSWGWEPDRLEASLKAVGQINPLVLWPQGNRLKLLCGHRRRCCLKSLGQSDFSALVLPEDVSPRQALDFTLEENLGHRSFNDAEKVLAVKALDGCFEREVIIQKYMKKLDIPPRTDFFDRFLRLSELGPEGLDALARERLDPETGEKLAGLENEDRQAVLALLEALRPGRNRRREIWEWLDEISRRETCSISEILRDESLEEILNDPKLNRPQKEAGVRRALRVRRFPRLTGLEKERAFRLKSLSLPPNISLNCPQNFEGLDFSLVISFSNLDAFRKGVAFSRDLGDSEDLAELVKLG